MERAHRAKITQLLRAAWQRAPDEVPALLRQARGMSGTTGGSLTPARSDKSGFAGVAKLLNARVKKELLVREYLSRVRTFADLAGCCELLRKLALVFERHGDPGQACAAVRVAFELVPHDAHTMVELERLGRIAGRWLAVRDALAAKLEAAQLNATTTAEQRIDLLWQLAELQRVVLGQPGSAAERLEQLLSIEPTNLPALEQLALCYEQLGDTPSLVDCLERTVANTDDLNRLVALNQRLADLFTVELVDEQRALEAYERVIELDPQNEAALWALAEVYERRLRFADAVELLRRVLDLPLPPQRQARVHQRLGELFAERLFDKAKAREHFEAALAVDPQYAPASVSLAELGARPLQQAEPPERSADEAAPGGTGVVDAAEPAVGSGPPFETVPHQVGDSGAVAVSRLVRMVKPIQAALERLATELARGNYRRRTRRTALHPSGTELDVSSPEGTARIRMAYERLSYHTEIIVYPPGRDYGTGGGSGFVAWLRGLLGWPSAQQRADWAWVKNLVAAAGVGADGMTVETIERSPKCLLLRIRSQQVPKVEQLEGWLRAAQQRLSGTAD